MGDIVLCADSESIMRPWMMGLSDVELPSVDWIKAFSDAQEARNYVLETPGVQEVWVVSSDSVEAVNLVAAFRKDNHWIPIVLVLSELTGSSLSRANAAGATHVFTTREFMERFNLEKQLRLDAAAAGRRPLRPEDAMPLTPVGRENKEAAPVIEVQRPKSIIPEAAAPTKVVPCRKTAGSSIRQSFVMGVVSGSGGAGKSLVAACIAYISASQGARTVLLDCDLQFGDLKILTGNKSALTMDDVIADPSQVARAAQEAASAPALIAAPQRLEASEILGNHLGVVVDECSKYFDSIIINTGASWTETHAVVLECSNSVLMLVDQRASSIYAAQHAVELCQRLGIAIGNFSYCLNRCCKNSLFNGIDLACVLNGAHIFELKDGGSEVEELAGAGCIDALLGSKNDFISSLKELAHALLPDVSETRRRARTHIKADPEDGRSGQPTGLFSKRRKSGRRRHKRNVRSMCEAGAFAKAGAL